MTGVRRHSGRTSPAARLQTPGREHYYTQLRSADGDPDAPLANTTEPPPALTRVRDPAVQARCQALAETPPAPWVEPVMTDWPGPIAHEYKRLHTLLAEGNLIGAAWQLKDTGEVLIRFIALVMAHDAIEHCPDTTLTRELRRRLLGPPMTMGAWYEVAVETLAKSLTAHLDVLRFPTVVTVLARPPAQPSAKAKATPLAKALNELVQWRNKAFGHGAFQLDLNDFLPGLEAQLKALNAALADAATSWEGIILHLDDPTGPLLMGADTLQTYRRLAPPHTHTPQLRNLWLVGTRGTLGLRPYISLRQCRVCAQQDLFLFDWRRFGRYDSDKYGFIDYLTGHAMGQPWFHDEDLHREVKYLPAGAEPPLDAEDLGGAYIRHHVEALLEERTFATLYTSPVHLRGPLKDFIDTHPKGVFWLQAPAHVGKTVFVQGLDPTLSETLEKEPLRDNLAIVAFYIRREYQHHPQQLEEQLWLRLRDALGISAQTQGLPRLDLTASDPAAAFARWLNAFFKAGKRLEQQLLVCLDGLDELPPPHR